MLMTALDAMSKMASTTSTLPPVAAKWRAVRPLPSRMLHEQKCNKLEKRKRIRKTRPLCPVKTPPGASYTSQGNKSAVGCLTTRGGLQHDGTRDVDTGLETWTRDSRLGDSKSIQSASVSEHCDFATTVSSPRLYFLLFLFYNGTANIFATK